MSDVVVVGGGAIGLASAWRLAQRGLTVEVVDPSPGGGASGVAAGMLAPVTEARPGEEDHLRLGLASLARWPALVAELTDELSDDAGLSYREDGTVVVALDADDRAALHELVDRQRSLGLEVADLSTRDIRGLEPGLAPSVRRGALAATERSVDPAALVAALLTAGESAGVRFRRERVEGLVARNLGRNRTDLSVSAEISTEGVGGVELAGGERLSAGTVVLAAGAWSGDVGGLPEPLRLPVRPVKGQVVTLRQRPGDTVVRQTVRGFVRGSSIYLVPRDDGRLVCGATVEERGWDPVATAGASYELLRDVLTLFPGLDDAELVGARVGFRPGSPDDLPLIGATGVDGMVVATGHYRNGILLAPITADAVAASVTGEDLPPEVVPCDPRRFTDGADLASLVPESGRERRQNAEAVAR
ncbi:MAG: glycine oxidase ThiO [Acidimicrobiales bacterium]